MTSSYCMHFTDDDLLLPRGVHSGPQRDLLQRLQGEDAVEGGQERQEGEEALGDERETRWAQLGKAGRQLTESRHSLRERCTLFIY